MSVATVMAAWVAFLGQSPFNLTVYQRRPPLPYVTGTVLADGSTVTAVYPFGVILPRTQTKAPSAGAAIQQGGLYRLIYIDQMGATYTTANQIETAAAAFADLLGDTLASSITHRTLGNAGAIAWAGEGQGVITQYDEGLWGRDDEDQEIYRLPIDIDVLEQDETGL